MRRITTLLALSMMVACRGAPAEPPVPPPLNPTGTFNLTIVGEGIQIGGSLVIRSAADGYTGSIDTDMGGASISDITVAGQELSFTVPEAGVSFQLLFEGEGFTGTFDGAMGPGSIVGVRREGSDPPER